ncbi:copper resistance CopC family protein [Angustibacter sp. McL0619]|uniref:copper resistance CopC family protein n=1 Tax=Angustibacter sp. McL0619 TaxID=3415676 RepID=UPI003CF48DBF
MPFSLAHSRRRVLALAAATAVTLGPASAASAHDQLASTVPAAGSQVSAPTSVTLTFGEDVLAAGNGNRIVVTGPDGPVPGALSVRGAVVATTFAQPLPPARYLVAWRVASDDGHPVSGTFRFTALAGATAVSSPSVSTPGASTPVASAGSTHSHDDEAGGPGRVLLLVLFVGAALSAGTIVLARRRQREAS